LSGVGVAGYDVLISADASAARLAFAGNIWDHAPPTILRGSGVPNGGDLVLAERGAPALDVSGAAIASEGCSVGVAGP
jgi:hypothetical protein